jgi:signal transduction histidine kinase
MKEKVLVVDDDRRVLRTFARNLTLAGYEVLTAGGGEEALDIYHRHKPAIVLLDVRMPPPDGFAVLQAIREQSPNAEVILVTGHGDMGMAVDALRAGASDFITKPIEPEILSSAMHNAHERLMLKRELQQARQELEQYAADLETRNRELDLFASTVAHDLKSPLGLIVGFTELLMKNLSTLTEEEVQQELASIARAGRKMSDIVEELLFMARVRRLNDVPFSPLDMSCILSEAMSRLTHHIDEHEAQFVLPTTWPVVRSYAPWIEEVWYNYISNAIKYGGRPPHIELGATVEPEYVRFWIQDNGPGVSPEIQEHLFLPFMESSRRGKSGHGLGLSIVGQIVHKLRGEVGVESEVGAGSRFWFSLPRGEVK